jgi:ABC-type Na+ efflux pump permease subunit
MLNRLFTIVAREFRVNVFSTQFLAVTFLVPIMSVLSIVVVVLSEGDEAERRLTGRVAVVDSSGLLELKGHEHLIPYAAYDSALAALQEEDVDDVVVVPSDWLVRGRYRRVTRASSPLSPPKTLPVGPALLDSLLRSSGVPDTVIRHRATHGTREELLYAQPDGRILEFDLAELTRTLFFPLGVAMSVLLAIATGSGLLVHGLGEEKENRALEMLLAVATPGELYAGKFLGLLLCCFCQLVLWGGGAAGFALFEGVRLGIGFSVLAVAGISFVLGYLFYAGMVFGFAALAESQRGIQHAIMVPMMILSFAFMAVIPAMSAPYGSFAAAITWLPFTAPLVAVARLSAGTAAWHVAGGLTITLLAVIWSQFVAVRFFTWGLRHRGARPPVSTLAAMLLRPWRAS